MNSSVIIVAAGKGKRIREKIPKQYLNLDCESIINLTIKKFLNIKEVKYILPVINAKHIKLYNKNIHKIRDKNKQFLHIPIEYLHRLLFSLTSLLCPNCSFPTPKVCRSTRVRYSN